MSHKCLAVMTGLLLGCLVSASMAAVPSPARSAAGAGGGKVERLRPAAVRREAGIDHSGRAEQGHASWYGPGLGRRTMADGDRMNPRANVAASKTLPLGTTATVTNLRNGRTAMVKIEDRGPFVDGRVVDVSPKVASELGFKQHGVVPVVVKPITVPQPNGAVTLGAGAAEATPQQLQQAAEATEALVGRPGIKTASRR